MRSSLRSSTRSNHEYVGTCVMLRFRSRPVYQNKHRYNAVAVYLHAKVVPISSHGALRMFHLVHRHKSGVTTIPVHETVAPHTCGFTPCHCWSDQTRSPHDGRVRMIQNPGTESALVCTVNIALGRVISPRVISELTKVSPKSRAQVVRPPCRHC